MYKDSLYVFQDISRTDKISIFHKYDIYIDIEFCLISEKVVNKTLVRKLHFALLSFQTKYHKLYVNY